MEKIDILPADFYNKPLGTRKEFLEANADQIARNVPVIRPIKGEDKERLKEAYIRLSLKLANLQAEYDEIKEKWKETLDPVKKEVKDHLEKLNTGIEQLKDDTYDIRDHDNGRVYTLLATGEVIDDRRMLPHERQNTIHNISNAK